MTTKHRLKNGVFFMLEIFRIICGDDASDVSLEYSSKFAFLKLPFSASSHSCLL